MNPGLDVLCLNQCLKTYIIQHCLQSYCSRSETVYGVRDKFQIFSFLTQAEAKLGIILTPGAFPAVLVKDNNEFAPASVKMGSSP